MMLSMIGTVCIAEKNETTHKAKFKRRVYERDEM